MNLAKTLITASMATVFATGCITVKADRIDYETTETLTLNADGLKGFYIDASAGFLKVEGDDSIDEIEVVAELAVQKDHYKLTLDTKGSKAVLIADANTENFSSWFGDSPKIDLTIKTPSGLKLDIDDGSGYITIKNIDADVNIDDGSGNLIGENLNGAVEIEDGSGDIELSNIGKQLKIDDGSGDINVEKVGGMVEIEDGSGEMVLTDIKGKVNLDDGSGDLTVKNVTGHVTIDDGSGDIDVDTLEDGLTVLSAGSGGLSISNVKGNIVTK